MGDVVDLRTGTITKSGNRLDELRCGSGASRRQLARAIGTDSKTIKGWEDGTLPIPNERQDKLAQRFGIGAAYLMGTVK